MNQNVAQAGAIPNAAAEAHLRDALRWDDWTLPGTLDDARSELNVIFQLCHVALKDEHGLQIVVSVLQAYPELASQFFVFPQFFFRRDAHLLPISIVMLSPAVNLKTIRTIHELYPRAVMNTSSLGGGKFLPLSLACMNKHSATKEILGFLVECYPNARSVHVESIGAGFMPPLPTLPFHFYVTYCIDLNLSDDDFESVHKDVCDLLWDEAFIRDTQESYEATLQYLFWATATDNCQYLLKYLIEKIPQGFRSLGHITVDLNGMTSVMGAASVVPLFNSVGADIYTDSDIESFWHALQLLESEPTKFRSVQSMHFPEFLPDQARDDILQSFQNAISTSRVLKTLSLCTDDDELFRPCPYIDALVNALGVNTSLEYLHLGYHIIIDLDCLFDLLQNAPKKLSAEALVVTATGDTEARSLPSANGRLPVLNNCRLEELFFAPSKIDRQTFSALFDKFSALPMLKSLILDLGQMEDPNKTGELDVTSQIVSLLERGHVEELTLYRMKVDIVSLCEHLKGNKTLLKLNFWGCSNHEQVHGSIGKVVKSHNTSLKSVYFSFDYPMVKPAWGHSCVDYYMLLNKCGRGRVRSQEIPLKAFVDLLAGLGERKDVHAYQKREGEINMIYGLLRLEPSLWVPPGGLDTVVEKEGEVV